MNGRKIGNSLSQEKFGRIIKKANKNNQNNSENKPVKKINLSRIISADKKYKYFTSIAFVSSIILLLFCFCYIRYFKLIERLKSEIKIASYQVETVFVDFLEVSEMLLSHIGNKIILNSDQASLNSNIVGALSTYSYNFKEDDIVKKFLSSGMFHWVDSDKFLIASSFGMVSKPIDLSSRDYLEKTYQNPQKVYIGSPIIGAVSGYNVLPTAYGIVNNNGKFLGTLVLSVKMEDLLNKFRNLNQRGFEFAILDNDNKFLVESKPNFFSENEKVKEFISSPQNIFNKDILSNSSIAKEDFGLIIERSVDFFPYKILVVLSEDYINQELKNSFFIEVIEFLIITSVCILFTFLIVKKRFIK